jgi:hypothetical protein
LNSTPEPFVTLTLMSVTLVPSIKTAWQKIKKMLTWIKKAKVIDMKLTIKFGSRSAAPASLLSAHHLLCAAGSG